MRTSAVAASILPLILAACSAGENPATTASAENRAAIDQVRARMDAYIASARQGDSTALSDYWTADALIMGPEEQKTAAEENKAAAEALSSYTITTFDLTVRARVAHDGGTTVYEFGRFSETLTPKDGQSAPLNFKGNYATRWVKSAEGKWRMHRFISAPPAPDSVKIGAAAPAVAPAAGPELDAAAASAQAVQALNDFTARINAGDAAGALPLVADDIQLYEPDVQIMSKTEFAGLLHAVLDANTVNIGLTMDQVFTHDGGAVAYLFAHFDESLTAKDGKTAPIRLQNNMLARWKRSSGGAWVLDRMVITPLPRSADARK
jgi:ketosteroid isomerase-like protein